MRWPLLLLAGCWLAVGCGSDPAPKPLTPDEEKQFEEQRQKDRQIERGRDVQTE
jgi:hypothetical protein